MKGWRTTVFNVLSGLAFLLTWDQLAEWVAPQKLATLVAGVNLVLRWFTTTPMGSKT